MDREPAVTPVEIGLVRYPGVQEAAVLGMTDLFRQAVQVRNAMRYPARHRGAVDHPLRVSHWDLVDAASADLERVFTTHDDPALRPTVLILPPSLEEPVSRDRVAVHVEWLARQHARGVALASVCAGAFVLGETGLLDDRTITTNWIYREAFDARFPRIRINADRLIVDDGDIITAGGAMAWTDLAMRLIQRHLGAAVMMATARRLVLDPPGREQRYYSAFTPRPTHGDAFDLGSLADRAGLELRTFQRRFRQATGMTPTRYCQAVRVAKAQEHLQFSRLPIDRVAWDVGYSDAGAFRKVFVDIVGLTPGEYRRRFGAAAAGLSR